jgi:uncharacterized protein (TIGR00375 family)
MRYIGDFHIHSKYARACSPLLVPHNLAVWSDKKGIGLLGTGDFTHPKWMEELENALTESEPGLYTIQGSAYKVRFLFTAEIASIYKQGDKVRRVHNMVFAPSMDAAQQFTAALEKRGANVKSDGRPIMGIHCDELVRIAKDIDADMHIIPAHAWTPHFGVFGSLSGFDSLEEAYRAESKYIWAIETGLSSDPAMNWQISALDNITLISNSDPHSLHRLGREANVFEIDEKKLSYTEVMRVMRDRNPAEFLYTVEFYPEEGRYHFDGHSDCKFSCEPKRTKELGGMCPVCGKKLLRGVLYRVEELSDRSLGHGPTNPIPYRNTISLEEVIAQVLSVGPSSKKVQGLYERMVQAHTEFEILLDMPAEDIQALANTDIADGITRMRAGKLNIIPGYDGVYGKIELYESGHKMRSAQQALF